MALKPKVLIAVGQGAGRTEEFNVEYDSKPITVHVPGLTAAETADLQIEGPLTVFTNVFDRGVQVQATPTNTSFQVVALGSYQIALGATASPVGVFTYGEILG